MTVADKVHAHLDRVEALQAELERRVRSALDGLDPTDVLDNYEQLSQDIVDELRTYISERLLSRLLKESVQFIEAVDTEDELTPDKQEAKRLIALLFTHYLEEVSITVSAILATLNQRAQRQTDLGRSSEMIVQELQNKDAGIGKLFTSLANQITILSDEFISSAAGIVVMTQNPRFLMWITVLDNRVCEDCGERHGEITSFDDWVEVGLPRSGWSVCGGRCRCVLVPYGGERIAPVERPRRPKQ